MKTEQTIEKVKRVTISQMGDSDSYRNLINQTGLDILFYLGKHYRPKILKRVVEEARKHYLDLFDNGKNKRFKGKVSIVAHSLGSVITYDLMTRQFPEYWLYRPTKDFEDTVKAAKGERNFDLGQRLPTIKLNRHMFDDLDASSLDNPKIVEN